MYDLSFEMHCSPPCADMSWTVRHAAVLGLSRVVRVCGPVAVQDGFSHVAKGRLTEAHSHEKEPRVLEAFKLAQVGNYRIAGNFRMVYFVL